MKRPPADPGERRRAPTRYLTVVAESYGRRWVIATAIYVAAVSAVAAVGDTRSAALLLIAVVLTLPTGVGAFVGVYFVYGALIGAARVLGARVMTGSGWNPHWFVVVDEVTVTALFATAAVANALLARRVAQRRNTKVKKVGTG